jgi:CheY-like chemotaxis protein
MHGKKILIVDDSQVDLRMLSLKLNANGYEVLRAEDGASAVSTARREKPDLILLDISFPPDVAHGGGVPWDGFLILNWLRRLEEAKDIPVIFISGKERSKTESRALQAGAVRYFQKPVNCDDLLTTIQKELASPKKGHQAKKRILFVDDEGDWRFVAGACLQDAGFEVVTAKDLTEALQRLETPRLDGIVLDLNLAGENGLLLMEFLKQKHPGIPILIYTGYQHDDEAVQNMLKQGARKYLRKGSMTELCDTLKSMVN